MIGRSLVSRLTFLQHVLALVVIVGFAASALWLTRMALWKEEATLLRETAGRIARNIDLELAEPESEHRGVIADELKEEGVAGLRIDLFDAEGRLLGSTGGPHPDSNSDGTPAENRSGERDALHTVRVRSGNGIMVQASVTGQVRRTAISALARVLLLTAIPILGITFLLSRWTSRRALRPLRDIGRRAQATSIDGGMRSLGRPSGLAEIDQMAESFDRLLARLNDLLDSERRFAADASHELRTPLTVVAGELESALGDEMLAPSLRPGLERAAAQTAAMGELVEALLLLRQTTSASPDRGGFEPINLCDLAMEVAGGAERKYPSRSGDLAVEAPDEILVEGQEILLRAALGNLVDNALKFTRPGQAVRIAVTGDPAVATVTVDDGGPGIPIEERERIFESFYRAAEARTRPDGFGLGLPILRRVARAHGGDVTVEDSPLGGARFALRLPAWGTRRRPPVLAPPQSTSTTLRAARNRSASIRRK